MHEGAKRPSPLLYANVSVMTSFQKKILKIVFRGFLILFFLVGILWYFGHDIKKNASLIFKYRQDLATQADILEKISSLEKDYQKTRDYFEKLKKTLPDESGLVVFESMVKNSAERHNLKYSFRFAASYAATENEPPSQGFNLILNGRQDNFLKWLGDLQKTPYFIKLDQVEIIKGETIDRDYTLKILGRVYMRDK